MGSKQFAKKQHRKLGKVDALLNEKLEKVEWGEFKLGDLFSIHNTLSFNTDKLITGNEYDYVTRTSQNQGILKQTGFVNSENINPAGNWSLGLLQMDFFYREKSWYAGQFVRKIIPKIHIPENAIRFFTTVLNNQKQKLLSVLVRDVDKLFLSTKILLPSKKAKIDFEFIENFIAALENERISKLANYLEVTGLKDYTLTDEEKEVLESFRNSKTSGGIIDNQTVKHFEWREFRLGDLFEINSSKKRFDANKVEISEVGQPYVVRTSLNNGIRGFINEEEQFINYGNTISFGQDTATMFYQEHPYFTGDKIKIVKSKDQNFNKKNAQFFITTMTKSFSSFSWGGSSFNVNVISSQMLNLPIQNNQPNYALMEIFISAIQKLVIKDVVLYANKKIAGTKSVVTKKE